MAIIDQILNKIEDVRENYAKPSGILTIKRNGSYDVKDYASAKVLVEGGAWDGSTDVTVRFYQTYYTEEDGETIRHDSVDSVSGYYSINGGEAIYFSNSSEVVLNKAVNVGDGSYIELYWWYNYYGFSLSETTTNCECELSQMGDYEYSARLYNFTGDATFEVSRSDW